MPYVLALLSATLFGIGDFLGGLATRRAALLAVVLTAQASGLIGLIAITPLLSRGTPPAADLAWGAVGGLVGGLGLALLFRGLATGLASVVAPVTAVCSIVVPVAVDVVGGVIPHATAVVGIALAMVAVALLSRGTPEPGAPHGRAARSVAIAIGSGVAIGVFLVCLARTSPVSGTWPLVAARVVAMTGFALACAAARQPLVPARPARGPALVSGLFDVSANALYVIAVRQGTLGPIATLASLYPASTVALARVVWRERLRPVQSLGLALAFLAIVLITWPARG